MGTGPEYGKDAPLLFAASCNKIEALRILLKHQANPNVTDMSGKTALHHIAGKTNTEAAQLLLDNGADVNIRDGGGKAPLDYTECVSLKDLLALRASRFKTAKSARK